MCKGAWKGLLKDGFDLSTVAIKDGAVVTLMGAAEKVAAKPKEEVKFVEDMTPAEVARTGAVMPAGLYNEGNTCYMNSTLECVRFVPELRSALTEWRGPSGPAAADATVAVTGELKGLMVELENSVEPVRPLRFLARLRQAFPQFAEIGRNGIPKQQDAEEFMGGLMTCLGNALTTPTPSVPELGDNGNALDAVIGFKQRVTMTCKEADAEPPTSRSEAGRKLVCNISGGPGSKDSVNELSEGIRLGLFGELEKHSETLGRSAVYKVERRLATLPRVFAVQFMRFFWKPTPDSADHAGVKCKIIRAVSFPLRNFDVAEFCVPEVAARLRANRIAARAEEERLLHGGAGGAGGDADMEDDDELKAAMALSMGNGDAADTATGGAGGATGSAAADADMGEDGDVKPIDGPVGLGLPEDFRGFYELTAVVSHKGDTADSGHYMGWVRKQPGSDEWMCFDDDGVSTVDSNYIQTNLKGGGQRDMAYLCFYRAQTQSVAEEIAARAAEAESKPKK